MKRGYRALNDIPLASGLESISTNNHDHAHPLRPGGAPARRTTTHEGVTQHCVPDRSYDSDSSASDEDFTAISSTWAAVETIIGYTFRNKTLLKTAFTRTSLQDETSNQKLEFLGDSLVGFLVAEKLYHETIYRESDMTIYRTKVVAEKPLADVITSLGLERYLRMGADEWRRGVDKHDKTKCDLYEALLGALYVDGGMAAARAFAERTLSSVIKRLLRAPADQSLDHKSRLKIYADKHHYFLEYDDVPVDLYSNPPLFLSKVWLNGNMIGVGYGSSKKEAQQAAAGAAWSNVQVKMDV